MSLPLRLRRGPAPGASVVRQGVFMVGCPTWPSAKDRPWWCSPPSPPNTPTPPGRPAASPCSRSGLWPATSPSTWSTASPACQLGSTIADLAGHYAQALERAFTGPVAVMGISTGGSIAQQFAIDHPQLVHRLVLVATACRLGPLVADARDLARFTLAGQPRRAWARRPGWPPPLGAAVAGRAQWGLRPSDSVVIDLNPSTPHPSCPLTTPPSSPPPLTPGCFGRPPRARGPLRCTEAARRSRPPKPAVHEILAS